MSSRTIGLCLGFIALLSLDLHAAETRVTLLHFSDYHSHAMPFYADGVAGQAGMARVIRYIRAERAKPNKFDAPAL